MGFLNIISSGRWSDSTTTSLLPKIYWSNFSQAKTMAAYRIFEAAIDHGYCAPGIICSISPNFVNSLVGVFTKSKTLNVLAKS